jgi:hypothetical protein
MTKAKNNATYRRAAVTAFAGGLALAFTASAALSMPLKQPQDYFGQPAMGAGASSGTGFERPLPGRATGHLTHNPAFAASGTVVVERPSVPVLGRERFAYRGANPRTPLVVAIERDGASATTQR